MFTLEEKNEKKTKLMTEQAEAGFVRIARSQLGGEWADFASEKNKIKKRAKAFKYFLKLFPKKKKSKKNLFTLEEEKDRNKIK